MRRFIPVCLSIGVFLSAAAAANAAPPTVTVLHAFNGTDGSTPYAPLVQASDGNFYGTTFHGGDDGHGCAQGCDGTVFKITPQGQFTLLHTFVGGGTTPAYREGRNPYGGLVEGPDGYLYGTTFNGGYVTQTAFGTVYKISKTGQFQKISRLLRLRAVSGRWSAVGKSGVRPRRLSVWRHDEPARVSDRIPDQYLR